MQITHNNSKFTMSYSVYFLANCQLPISFYSATIPAKARKIPMLQLHQ